ncbi:hypothetical protein EDD17DRAFT_626151 [Pisolithus thermaeus]|nr:hypothetical protein EV401DRAFT_360504 [Pisolithus croceorrhizus]KAI6168494.1 hypothetical protein EDD17DRAFT_626151 [Pisolithus thermaeus]
MGRHPCLVSVPFLLASLASETQPTNECLHFALRLSSYRTTHENRDRHRPRSSGAAVARFACCTCHCCRRRPCSCGKVRIVELSWKSPFDVVIRPAIRGRRGPRSRRKTTERPQKSVADLDAEMEVGIVSLYHLRYVLRW